MRGKFLDQVQIILNDIVSKRSNFYNQKYSSAGLTKKELLTLSDSTFNKLPVVNLKELGKSPYKNRLLNEKAGFNKLVFSESVGQYFLVHRNLDEIAQSNLPKHANSRPMVLLQDVYEAIETCLYFYGHKTLPLIGEVLNPAVVYATAAQYDIDSLYIDRYSIQQFRSELLNLKLKIKSVAVIGSDFSTEDLLWPKSANVNAVLSLPEFGEIAYACPEHIKKKKFVFHAFSHTLIEPGKSAVLTSVRLKSCPMIRYLSNLSLNAIDSSCKCGKPSFLLAS